MQTQTFTIYDVTKDPALVPMEVNVDMTLSVAKHWYHVSCNGYWEDTITLYPQHIENRYEPDFPKICVSDRVVDCFLASGEYYNRYRVYKTIRPHKAIPAQYVYDAHLTNEHWLVKPTRFKLIHQFCQDDVKRWPQFTDLKFHICLREYTVLRNRLIKIFNTMDLSKEEKWF